MIRKQALVVSKSAFYGLSYADFVAQLPDVEISLDYHKFMYDPARFHLLVFIGGEDVAPSLYGDTSPLGYCGYNLARDRFEQELFQLALKNGIKMFGICRGAQFLNVMTGGKLVHHLDGHVGLVHEVVLCVDDITATPFAVMSTHHQMCLPGRDTYVIAKSRFRLSNVYYGDKDEKMNYDGDEVEAIYCPSQNALGVQWHPEMMPVNAPGRRRSLDLLSDFLYLGEEAFTRKYVGQAGLCRVREQA